jgi:hypothetical protein
MVRKVDCKYRIKIFLLLKSKNEFIYRQKFYLHVKKIVTIKFSNTYFVLLPFLVSKYIFEKHILKKILEKRAF